MLHHDKITLIIEWNTEISQEGIGRLSHNHGGEELAAEPSSTAWRDGGLDNGDLQVWASFAKHVSGAETAGACPDDDDVRLGVGVQVVKVATGHGARDLRLSDGSEGEAGVPLVGHFLEGLGLHLVVEDWCRLDGIVLLHLDRSLGRRWLGKHGGRRRHD